MNTIYHNSTEKGKYTLSPANRKSLTAVYCSFAKHKSNGIPLLRETGRSMIPLATNTTLIFLNNRLSKFLQPTKIRQWGRLFLNCKMPNNENWLTVTCILFHEIYVCVAVSHDHIVTLWIFCISWSPTPSHTPQEYTSMYTPYENKMRKNYFLSQMKAWNPQL